MRSYYQMFKDSLHTIFSAPTLFLSILAVPAVVSVATSFVEAPYDVDGNFMFVANAQMFQYLMAMGVASLCTLLMVAALIFAVTDTTASALVAYKKALNMFLKYLGLNLAMAVLIFLGLLLLILPGIWLMISLTFSGLFLLLRGRSIKESLQASHALVKGRWGSVFVQYIMLGILSILLLLPFYIAVWIFQDAIGVSVAIGIEALIGVCGTLLSTVYTYHLFTDLEATKIADITSSIPPAQV